MSEQASATAELGWYWGEADPKTLTIIGAFATEPKGLISMEKITADVASHGFLLDSSQVMPTQQIIKQAYAEMAGEDYVYDPNDIPKTIVDRLKACEPDHMRAVLQELGQLAGGSREIAELELIAGDRIEAGEQYETIPTLTHLSQLAMDRVVMAEENGWVHFAPSPRGVRADYFFRDDLIGS